MAREMKDSGIEWIGEIPEKWEVVKTKTIFKNLKRIVGEKETEYERLALTLKGVIKRDKNDSKGLQSEKFSTYQIVNQDELVFKMIDLENASTSRVGYSNYTGIVSPVYIILNNKKYSRYGYYYFYDMWQRKIFNSLGNTAVRSSLNSTDMSNIPFLKISFEEQEKIVSYLDKKVSEIDLIIEKTKITIEDYKKYKQSIITKAVTQGLNSNVEMKDSGIEWIGKIPKYWKIFPIKYILKWKSEKNYPNEMVLSLYRDYGVIPKDSRDDNHNVTSEDTASYKFVEVGDFVINKMKAWQGSMAVSDYQGIVSPAYHVCSFKTNELNKKYFHYLLRNQLYLPEFRRLSTGLRIGQWDLGFEDFKQLPYLFPPLEEQNQIVEYIDKKTSEIDALITKKEALIKELEEYKKSLIYECVTGKKEVNENV